MSIDATAGLVIGQRDNGGRIVVRQLRDAIRERADVDIYDCMNIEHAGELADWALQCRELLSRIGHAGRVVEAIRDNATTADARSVHQWAIEALRAMEGR